MSQFIWSMLLLLLLLFWRWPWPNAVKVYPTHASLNVSEYLHLNSLYRFYGNGYENNIILFDNYKTDRQIKYSPEHMSRLVCGL